MLFPMNFDTERKILEVVLRDYVLPPGMRVLRSHIKRHLTRLGVPAKDRAVFIDCRELDNMAHLIDEWNQMLGPWSDQIVDPVALVVDPARVIVAGLAAVLTAPSVAVFDDVSNARAWLMRSRFEVVSA